MKKRISVFLIAVAFVVMTAFSSVKAIGDYSITIDSLEEGSSKVFKVWKVSDYSPESYKRLLALESNELDSLYGESYLSNYISGSSYKVSGLDVGYYYGVEIKDGKINREIVPFMISFNSETAFNETIVPKKSLPKTTLEIKNIGITEEESKRILLPNSTFMLFYENSNVPLRFIGNVVTTDANGVSELSFGFDGILSLRGLLPGKYRLKQLTAPSEYLLSNDIFFEIKLGADNEVYLYNYQTGKIGTLTFKLLSARGNKPLKGGVFKLVKLVHGKYVDVLIDGKVAIGLSDENGNFVFKNIKYGDYYLVQLEAPTVEGVKYIPLLKPFEFKLDGTMVNKEIVIKIFNQKSGISSWLPETGEQRSILFIGTGVILLIISFLLTFKRRKKKEENEEVS